MAHDEVADGRPVLFRNATVLTMDDAHGVLTGGDVLVVGDRIAEVGHGLAAPDGALEIDASNVLCTAFHRDRSAAAALLENSFAAGALDPHVIRLVEFDGKPAEVTLRLPGPIASAARTDLLGGVLERLTPRAASAPFGPAQLPWSALRFSLRPHEIATIQVDLEFGRHQPLDPAKARLAWAAASRRR
jgi:hypothetical protein